jgi:hypothetical protein
MLRCSAKTNSVVIYNNNIIIIIIIRSNTYAQRTIVSVVFAKHAAFQRHRSLQQMIVARNNIVQVAIRLQQTHNKNINITTNNTTQTNKKNLLFKLECQHSQPARLVVDGDVSDASTVVDVRHDEMLARLLQIEAEQECARSCA